MNRIEDLMDTMRTHFLLFLKVKAPIPRAAPISDRSRRERRYMIRNN